METMTMTSPAGGPSLDRDRLTAVVRRATGRDDAQLASIDSRPAAHRVENMTTSALTHVFGTLTDGTSWRVFAKTLRPAWLALLWDEIPPMFHDQVRRSLNWQDEPRIYRGPLAGDVPGDLRLPELYGIDEGEEHVTLWLEDVADTSVWDLDRYRRSARALGRLSGRWSEARAVEQLPAIRRRPMGELFHGKISNSDIPMLRDDSLWETPMIRAVVERDPSLRADLERLADVCPALVDLYSTLPHRLAHGDATPDNLHEPGPADGKSSGDIVAIDLSYVSPAPVGADLSQLFVGRFESGAAAAADVHPVADAILPAYCEGLADEGIDIAPELVEAGWAIALAVRSVFSALHVGHRTDLDEAAQTELLLNRAAACRFGIDLALRVADRMT